MHKIFEGQNLSSALLRSFLAIAKHKNLTRAADELFCAQSTLSLQLKKLETELDTVLFVRRSRGMELTREGRMLLPYAEAISSEMQKITEVFRQGGAAGSSLSIGIPDDFEGRLLELALTRFGRTYPEVRVNAEACCTSRFAEDVESGGLDMAIVSGPSFVSSRPFNKERNHWVRKRGCDVHELETVPLALLERSCWWGEMVMSALTRHGRSWQVVYTSPSIGCARSAILTGRAVGVLSESQIDPRFEILGRDEGFPELPCSSRSVIVGAEASRSHVDALVEDMRFAWQQLNGAGLRPAQRSQASRTLETHAST